MKSDDPLADNLFSRLFSYTPRIGREPMEDYCAEALAWCLRNSRVFREQFLSALNLNVIEWFKFDADVHTQLSFKMEQDNEEDSDEGTTTADQSGGRFDMVIFPKIGREFVIVFEMKVEADFSPGQLENYRRELDNGQLFAEIPKRNRWIATVTNSSKKHPLANAHILWSSIQVLLTKTAEQIASETVRERSFVGEVCSQLAKFLGEHGMKPIEIPKTNQEQLRQKIDGILFREKLTEFLKHHVREHDSDAKDILKNRVVINHDAKGTFLGMYNKNHLPYFYVGVQLTDEKDTPDFSLWVEAASGAKVSKLKECVSPELKDSLEPWDRGGFVLKKAINLDCEGNASKMLDWFAAAIQEARKLSSVK